MLAHRNNSLQEHVAPHYSDSEQTTILHALVEKQQIPILLSGLTRPEPTIYHTCGEHITPLMHLYDHVSQLSVT